MLENRMLFVKANPGQYLNEFVIFGKYYLDQFGQIISVEKLTQTPLAVHSTVERFEAFQENNKHAFALLYGLYSIPTPRAVCTCCGKKITLGNAKKGLCIHVDGKFYHFNCWQDYAKLAEIDKLYYSVDV